MEIDFLNNYHAFKSVLQRYIHCELGKKHYYVIDYSLRGIFYDVYKIAVYDAKADDYTTIDIFKGDIERWFRSELEKKLEKKKECGKL